MKSEQTFEYRIQKLLRDKGYLVINCARSKPFDLVATKEGLTYHLELKAKKTRYPKEQQAMQTELANQHGLNFAVITQSHRRGKIKLEFMKKTWWRFTPLEKDLKHLITK